MRPGRILFFLFAIMMIMITVERARGKPETYLVETADDVVPVDPPAEPHGRTGLEEEPRGSYNKV